MLGDNLKRPVRVLFIVVFSRCALASSSSSSSSSSSKDEFHEELLLRPLPSGHVHAHFQFVTTWHVPVHNDKGEFDASSFRHYHLFPKALGEIISQHRVQELRLSQTMGLWRTSEWGYPVSSAPPGVELWTWFHPSISASVSSDGADAASRGVDAAWKRLVNAISGLSCSSLNFLVKDKVTVSPNLSFKPTGAVFDRKSDLNSSLLRYGALPREIVCTENLTPWKKLLPCDSKAGLATLFNDAKKLYDTAFHSLVVHLRPVCRNPECSETSLELVQSLSVVFDPIVQNLGSDWSLKRLFGKVLISRCPVASSSKVMVELTSNGTRVNKDGTKHTLSLTPSPSSINHVTRGGATRQIAVYDLKDFVGSTSLSSAVLNVNCKITKKKTKEPVDNGPDLHSRRHVTGNGQHLGGIATVVENAGERDTMVVLMETVPWYLRTFYHTIALKIIAKDSVPTLIPISPHYLSYFPSKDNERSTLMEIAFTVPAKSAVRISYEFERAFLQWTAYPPDANHGFYVPSGVLTAVLHSGAQVPSPSVTSSSSLSSLFLDSAKSFPVRVYTEALLVTMPTPDFSMPYNVICLVSTAVAIAFGTVHNQATRRFVRVSVDEMEEETLFSKVKNKIKGIFKKKSPEEKQSSLDVADGNKTNNDEKEKDEDVKEDEDTKEDEDAEEDEKEESATDSKEETNGSCVKEYDE